MAETPKFIRSHYGEVFLIEHQPDDTQADTWVIALNSGLQSRTSSRRLYVRMARQLAEMGYGVIRVDLPGVGDSDGPQPPTHFDMHQPDHVREIISYAKRTHQPGTIILLGLCAGARVAVKAAYKNDDVSGTVALSMPTFTASPGSTRSPDEAKGRMSESVAKNNLDRVKSVFSENKFLSASFWRRHLNPKVAFDEIKHLFRSIAFLVSGNKSGNNLTRFVKLLIDHTNYNDRTLFLFGERDKIICEEFKELDLKVDPTNVIVIPGGNHTFSSYSCHRLAVSETCNWIERRFPAKA